jgi:hypothetical protein
MVVGATCAPEATMPPWAVAAGADATATVWPKNVAAPPSARARISTACAPAATFGVTNV